MLFLLAPVYLSVFAHAAKTPIVNVEQGCLRGEELKLAGSVVKYYSFKGVPYAKPPLGKLRFKAPQPPEPWKGVKNATKHGSICTQFQIYDMEYFPGSEDCLFLNVYTPSLEYNASLPVMLYVHGGGFKSTSGNDDMFGPDFLVKFGVVLVTINYRLEVLGFLKLDIPEVPGNAGMKDQVAALKWVQKNIKNFGGDPDNVTVFGQSAGGVSAILHMISSMSKGLFKRVIAMSGVPNCDFASPFELRRKAFILGAQLGFQTNNPYKLLDFLQSVPAEKLRNVNTSAILSEDLMNFNGKLFHFVPTVEIDFGNNFITEQPLTALKKGHVHEIDLMIGQTNQEYLWFFAEGEKDILKKYKEHPDLFVPSKILHAATPQKILQAADRIKHHYFNNKPINLKIVKELLKCFTESGFSYDIYRFLKYLPKVGNAKRYLYLFTCQSGRNIFGNVGTAKYGVKGAAHMDDLAYIFNPRKYNLPMNPKSKDYKLALQVSLLYTNFAKYGNPTPDFMGNVWQEYDSENRSLLEIGDSLTPGTFDMDHVYFWENVFKDACVEF